MTCLCGAVGFKASVLGPDHCAWCDGTVGGNCAYCHREGVTYDVCGCRNVTCRRCKGRQVTESIGHWDPTLCDECNSVEDE